MAQHRAAGLFVTGTDTGVGKTIVAAAIVRTVRAAGVRVGVYKPAASGCRRDDRSGELVSDDAVALWEAAGRPLSLEQVCPQRFLAPLAPAAAARNEGRRVDADRLRRGIEPWLTSFDFVVVEGVGGLMSPVSDEDYVADLADEFGMPLVVVAPNQLGVINQTLQTLITASAFRRGLPIAGVVLNDVRRPDAASDPSVLTNGDELAARCIPPLLAHFKWQADGFHETIDWLALAGPIQWPIEPMATTAGE